MASSWGPYSDPVSSLAWDSWGAVCEQLCWGVPGTDIQRPEAILLQMIRLEVPWLPN